MKTIFHVPSIGSAVPSTPNSDRFLKGRGYVLAVADGYRDLFQTALNEGCEVAVQYQTLTPLKELIGFSVPQFKFLLT
jgi:hypothetical protein